MEATGKLPAPGYQYDAEFFRYIEGGSLRSARVVIPLVLEALAPRSVLDVGCGAGAWLSVYREHGIGDSLGVDGAYVNMSSLLVPGEAFASQDVSLPFDLKRRFDLVQSLEVAEHIPAEAAAEFVANLVRHGDRVLFSAATPGQGGEFHVNEQPFSYWRKLFASHGYRPYDPFRPRLAGNSQVESWYRYNMVLYVSGSAAAELPAAVVATAVADGESIRAVSPLGYNLRSLALSVFPSSLVSAVARGKHALVLARLRRQRRG